MTQPEPRRPRLVGANCVRPPLGNGANVEFIYDDLDRVKEKKYNGETKLIFSYNKAGLVYQAKDLFANTTTRYEYDLSGRIIGAKVSDGSALWYGYDEYNRISRIVTTTSAGAVSSVEFVYGDSSVSGQKTGLLYGVKHNGTQPLSYAYDSLSRLSARTIETATPFTTAFTYLEGADETQTTTLVKTVKNGTDTLEYTYDAVGNITSVKKNGALVW